MGIYDRDYYREDTRWSNPFARSKATVVLILVLAGVFIAQLGSMRGPAGVPRDEVSELLRLDVDRVLAGEAWRVASYAVVHQPAHILHLIWTCVFLAWIGHSVEDLYGSKEYVCYFVFTSLLGGAAYTAVGALGAETPPLLGPSGAVTSILILFALHYPTRRIFYFPVWLVVAVYALIDIAGLTGASRNPAGVAVHFVGAAFAFVYHTWTLRVSNWLPGRSTPRRQSRPTPRPRSRQQKPEPEPVAAASGVGGPGPSLSGVDEHLEAKLDEVLEKVAKSGKDSLTDPEREILRKASEIYKRRRGG